MGEGKPKPKAEESLAQQYLDHVNEKFSDAAAKLAAIDDELEDIKKEHKRLKDLVDLTRRQIMAEDPKIDDLRKVQPSQPSKEYKYKVEISPA